MYEEHVSTKPDPASRAFACQTVLQVYTIKCYKFEARVQDYNNFISGENMLEYSQYILAFQDKFFKLLGKSLLMNYYLKLLLLTIHWSPAERTQFLSIRNCLNSFQAPEYNKITPEILSEAVDYGIQISEERLRHKRKLTNAISDCSPNKRFKVDPGNTRPSPVASPSGTPQVTCTTDKYTRTFTNWKRWVRSKLLKKLLNSAWKKTGANRNFQPFQLPTINKTLTITRHERDFRSQHNLCVRCGNHTNNDGKQCELHPLYDDVKIDNRTILGWDTMSSPKIINSGALDTTTSFNIVSSGALDTTTSPNITSSGALDTCYVDRTASPSTENVLEKYFPKWKRDLMEKASAQAPSKQTSTAEILNSDGFLCPVTFSIGTQSPNSFVTKAFLRRHNLDSFVFQPRKSLVTRARLHNTVSVCDSAIWISLYFEEGCTDVMAYVFDKNDSEDLMLGMDWMTNYNVSLAWNDRNGMDVAIGRTSDY